MAILTMESTVKSTKYGNSKVADLVNNKGCIFSMIKDGYEFDDEVLAAAHIQKNISNVRIYNRVGGDEHKKIEKLNVDTSSVKQILSELHTIENYGKYDDKNDETEDNWNDSINDNNFEDGDNE